MTKVWYSSEIIIFDFLNYFFTRARQGFFGPIIFILQFTYFLTNHKENIRHRNYS